MRNSLTPGVINDRFNGLSGGLMRQSLTLGKIYCRDGGLMQYSLTPGVMNDRGGNMMQHSLTPGVVN